MGIRTDRSLIQLLIFFSILVQLIALFTSRVLLSAGLIFFLACTCLHRDFGEQVKNFLRQPMLVAISLLFFIPLLTYGWSEDKSEWFRWARIKLPLFLLPLAFAGKWQLSAIQWKWIALCFALLVFGGCCWSLYHYYQDYIYIQESYLRAKVMPTPLENDHVRFSLLVCTAVITSVFIFTIFQDRKMKWLAGIMVLFFSIYLHILSARTGLIGFYLFILFGTGYLLFHLKNRKWTIALVAILLAMPVAAWLVLPTFRNRIRYNLYDLSFIKKDTYLPGSNDGNRVLSLQAGWDILTSHPFGVGSGDVVGETWKWYEREVPQMLETDKLYPASEWLCYGDAAGWPGFILFTAIMVLPFFLKKMKHSFFWMAINLTAAFSLFFDIGLETQFGVFIYGFVVLWWWKERS